MRVCLDTNVLVAAFATRGLCADVFRTVLAEHDLIVGEVILEELRRVLASKLKLSDQRVAAVVAVLASFPAVPRPPAPVDLPVRDPADRWILSTAIAGGAEVLVTGDRDLLDARAQAPLRILDPREFWELLREGRLR